MSALSYAPSGAALRTRPLQSTTAVKRAPSFAPTPAGYTQTIDRTAVLRAAEAGDVRQLRRLIADGADINAADTQGWTPLMRAAKNHHLKAVAELITAGADLHAETRNGWNALSIAVKAGSPQIIALLASAGGKTTNT